MINKSDRKNCTLFFSNCQNEIEDGIMCVSNEQCHMRVKQKMAARRHFVVLLSCDKANARQSGKSLIFRTCIADESIYAE